MNPQHLELEPFLVSGLAVRTRNADEARPGQGKLAGLWGRFFGQNIAENLPNRVDGSPIFGVYADYESGGEGLYTVTAGLRVARPAKHFETVAVKGGRYLVFEGRGPMPQVVIATWAEVWAYFGRPGPLRRRFDTDFELYRGADAVAVHVGVAPAD